MGISHERLTEAFRNIRLAGKMVATLEAGAPDELQSLRARWPDLEIRQCGSGDVRYDVSHRGLGIPFGSVMRESEGIWRWMTPAWGFPGREPQAPPGHPQRFGIRAEGSAANAQSAMVALVEGACP